jgi:hypothetical protein
LKARSLTRRVPAEWESPRLADYVSQFRTDLEYHARNQGREVLVELANLRDDSCSRFRKAFPMLDVSSPAHLDDGVILRLREQLQILWRREKEEDPAIYLNGWLIQSSKSRLLKWVVWSNSDGTYTVAPNYGILSLLLAFATSAWQAKMAVCKNPDCLRKYFLKSRNTQRFCDNDACLAYGQRQHKLAWWEKNRDKWKRSRVSRSERSLRKRSRPVR